MAQLLLAALALLFVASLVYGLSFGGGCPGTSGWNRVQEVTSWAGVFDSRAGVERRDGRLGV